MASVTLVIAAAQQKPSAAMPFTVVEYNCENLYDCRHDSLKDDTEFLPDSKRQWTPSRYWRKLNGIARVIHQCGGKGKAWRLPDIVALLEVENDSTMLALTRRSMIRTGGYRYVMTQSPDIRGIDVAMLYNPLTFQVINHHAIRITPTRKQRPTRDILYVKGRTRTNDTLHIFTIHAPSRRGGQAATEPYRIAVAQRMIQAIDSIRAIHHAASIIIAGDFNDHKYNKALKLLKAKGMKNVTEHAKGRIARGTYKHQGQWNSLDHILVSTPLAGRVRESIIQDSQWMLAEEKSGGHKPYRTYLGPHYNGGVSDHLPLVIRMEFEY